MAVKLDQHICEWVTEFLLRQPNSDSVVKRLLTIFPLPNNNPRLKKRILLRSIRAEISDASVSDTLLHWLELLHQIDRNTGCPVAHSLKAAYCSVAVHCTVKHLGGLWSNRDDEKASYLEALQRVWRGKIGILEESCSELVTDELLQWRDDFEAAIWDVGLAKRLLEEHKRNEAATCVTAYLREAEGLLGQSFLEIAARSEEERLLKKNNENGQKECNNDGDALSKKSEEGELHAKDGDCGTSKDEEIEKNLEEDKHKDNEEGSDQVPDNDTSPMEEDLHDKDADDLSLKHKCQEVLPQRDGDSNTGKDEVESIPEKQKEKEGLSGQVEDNGNILQQNVNTSLRNNKELEKNNCLGWTRQKHVPSHRRHRPEKRTTDAQDEDDTDDDYIDDEKGSLSSKYNMLPCPQISGVRETLTTRLMELQNLVQDPSPEALCRARGLLSDVQQNFVILQALVLEKCQSEKDKNPSGDCNVNNAAVIGLNKERIPVQAQEIECNQAKPESNKIASVHNLVERDDNRTNQENNTYVPPHNLKEGEGPANQQNAKNVPASLLERNHTARTFEWDESIDGTPEGATTPEGASKRFYLPSPPKRKPISPLSMYEPAKCVRRRKRKMWSPEEEDILRKAVDKFGKGNWKLILNAHRDVFSERTEVDLKDKWRNMMP